MPTTDELLELADRCAGKLDLDGKVRHVPSFSLSSCVVDRHSQPAVASVKPARSGAAVHVR